MTDTTSAPRDPIARLRPGYVAAAAIGTALAIGLAWAAFSRVETAAHADGTVIPVGQNRRAQHLEGGVVRELLVREGQVVAAGQPLVRIAPEQASAELGERRAKMAGLAASVARLAAEARGDETFEPGEGPAARFEAAAFVATRAALAAKLSALDEQARRAEADARSRRAQLEGLRVQEQALLRAVALQQGALAAGGGSQGRLVEAQAQLAAVRAQMAPLPAAAQSDDAAVREAAARRESEISAQRAEAAAKLAQATSELASLTENAGSAADRLRRTDVVSPVRGTIQKLNVNDVGEVVPPNSTVAEIVPLGDGLVVEARVRPEDLRGLRVGMRSLVRMSAYDASRFCTLEGELVSLSPDATKDERTGQTYYRARIRTAASEIGGEPVKTGMQASVSIVTGERSVLSYLVSPVTDWSSMALRER